LLAIKEIIVVEGRSDERAVKQAVDAEVIITQGFGLTGETLRRIATAQRRNGVIVFTDPDHAGELIRRGSTIASMAAKTLSSPAAKHNVQPTSASSTPDRTTSSPPWSARAA
jgi:ribonuclease M5